jgi:tRNA(fMet)-specific endonuclease VapC
MSSHLLDTTAASGVIRNVTAVQEVVRASEGVYLPIVVLGELYYGAYKADRPTEQMERVRELARKVTVLGIDDDTDLLFGQIRADLSRPGRMIPVNDLWIAAIALQYDLPVVTQDQHFSRVAGLTVISW